MLSSPHDSPFILVLCVSRSSRNSDGVTGGVWKCRNFRPITCYNISETVEDRWVYAARRFTSIEYHLYNRVTFTAIVPGAYPGEAKMCKNVLKWRTFELTGWITGKRLKIDGYMLRCVWQALNSLSIHVTFTAIVPGAYPGEAKMCLRLSWRSQNDSSRIYCGWRQRHTGVTLVR